MIKNGLMIYLTRSEAVFDEINLEGKNEYIYVLLCQNNLEIKVIYTISWFSRCQSFINRKRIG